MAIIPDLRDRLVGAWRLQSYLATPVDGGEPYAPLGTNPQGLIIYTSDGYMSAQLSTADREGFSSGDWFDGTAGEYVAEASTYIAYSGAYRVDDLTGILTHTMEVSLFPNWTGQTQVRTVELDGDTLTLGTATPLRSGGRTVMARLVWRRASSSQAGSPTAVEQEKA